MTTFHDSDLMEMLEDITRAAPISPEQFYAFFNVEKNTRLQIRKVKSHPWISKDIPVRGFIYDVHTGEMREVAASDGNAEAERDFSFPH